MRSRILVLLALLLAVSDSPVFAQNPMTMRRNDIRSLRKKDSRGWADRPEGENTVGISASIGTLGLGVEVKKVVSDIINLRLGTSMFTYKTSRTFTVDAGRSRAEGTASLGFNKFHFLAEAKLAPKFRFVGGLAYFYRSDIYVYGKMLDGIVSNGKNLTAEQAGALTIGIEWKSLSPYLGIGLFRDMPLGKFNANLDLGSYYIGKPTTKWIATGVDAQEKIDQYEKDAEKILSTYTWFPVLQLNINYAVK
jgi:hypothetical protein